MEIIFLLQSCVYGILMILSVIAKASANKTKLFTFNNTVWMIGCILIISANAGVYIKNWLFFVCLIVGLILTHAIAIKNGYEFYGKPNWRHHVIRFSISVLLIFLYPLSL